MVIKGKEYDLNIKSKFKIANSSNIRIPWKYNNITDDGKIDLELSSKTKKSNELFYALNTILGKREVLQDTKQYYSTQLCSRRYYVRKN